MASSGLTLDVGGYSTGLTALAGGAAGRGKEAEGIPGCRAVVGHVAALALEEGGVGRVCSAGKY